MTPLVKALLDLDRAFAVLACPAPTVTVHPETFNRMVHELTLPDNESSVAVYGAPRAVVTGWFLLRNTRIVRGET